MAEEMHLKAIMIKERLLGPDDFEVGLSLGHLASLYNYHMNLYDKAEQLYLRSIKISKCRWSALQKNEVVDDDDDDSTSRLLIFSPQV